MDTKMESEHPLDALMARIRDVLGGFTPEPLLERVRLSLEGFLEQFQLVSKRELDGHLARLGQLEETVAALEQRVNDLEHH